MKRVGKSRIGTKTFLQLPVIIELNGEPAAIMVPVPLTVADVEKTTRDLAELVKEQDAKDKG